MRLLHRVAVQNQIPAADGIFTHDLAVNPLSVILIKLAPLNETSTLTNFQQSRQICQALNRVSVIHRGSSIFSMRGEDAFMLNYHRHGIVAGEANPDDTDNERRSVILPLLMGRFAYDPRSCIPATIRGELVIELDVDIADTGYDALHYSIETVELIGATPREFERKTTVSQTFAATGDNDVFLPIGHRLRGLLCFGTTTFTGASPAPTLGRLSILGNGGQDSIASSDFEVMLATSMLMGRQPIYMDHTHRVDATAASATQETTGPIEYGAAGGDNYCFIDLDPTRDDTFSIDTAVYSDIVLRANAETANAVRVIAIEQVAI